MLLLASRDLLRRHCALPRSLARACIGVRALAANRQVAAMPQAAIRLNFNQPPDVHLRLFAQIAFDAAFGFDCRAQTRRFVFRQVLDLLGVVHVGFRGQRFRARLPDSVNRREPNPKPLVRRQIHTCDASHSLSSGLWPIPGAGGAWRSYRSRAPRRADERSCTSCRFSLPMPEPSFFHSIPSRGPQRSLAPRAALLVTINDSAASQIVRRKLHRHAISRQNTNKIFAHLPRNMGQHLVLVFQFHAKHRVGQRFDHGRHHFNGILFSALTRLLVFLLWPWSHALLCFTPANFCFLPLTRPDPPLLSAASESTVHSLSQPPCARSAPNRCRPPSPPSTHRPALARPGRPCSPSAQSPAPCPLATSDPGPVNRNSATVGPRASSCRFRGPRTRAPPNIRSFPPTAAPRLIHLLGDFPPGSSRCPVPATPASPATASRAPASPCPPAPSTPRRQNIRPAPLRNPSKECRPRAISAPPTEFRAPLPD